MRELKVSDEGRFKLARAGGDGTSPRVSLRTLGAGSLCPGQEKRTMRKPEAKSGL